MSRVPMRKIAGIAAGIAALFFGSQAFAVTCTIGACTITDGALSVLNPIGVSGADVELGAVDHQGSFAVEAGLQGLEAFIGVTFSEIFPGESVVRAGIANMTLELFQDSTSLGVFAITDSQGVAVLQMLAVNFISDSDLFFAIGGEAFRNVGASLPDYNIDFQAVEAVIPAPGAFFLLLSGLAGLGFAARRGKAGLGSY